MVTHDDFPFSSGQKLKWQRSHQGYSDLVSIRRITSNNSNLYAWLL